MTRIAIIGPGGSGKTTLTRALGRALSIRAVHLDRIFWRRDGRRIDEAEFADRQREICATQAWIVDGDYSRTIGLRMGAADTVVFLDMPTMTCLWRIARRYWIERREATAEPNGERIVALRHYLRCGLGIVWFSWARRQGLLRTLERLREEKDVFVLASNGAIDAFLYEVTDWPRVHAPRPASATTPTEQPSGYAARQPARQPAR